MTRFARAKGSKASNERLPNEPTPWHIMKQQLEDKISSKDQQPEKAKTAKQLLKEKDDPFYYDTTGNVNNDWAEFERPKVENSKSPKEEIQSNGENVSKKNKKKFQSPAIEKKNSEKEDLSGEVSGKTPKNKSNKRLSNISLSESAENSAKDVDTEKNISVTPNKKSKKRKSNGEASGDGIKRELIENGESNENVQSKKSKKRKSENLAVESGDNSTNVEEISSADVGDKISSEKNSKKRKSDASNAETLVENSVKVEETNEVDSEPKKKKKKKDKKGKNSSGENIEISESSKEKEEKEDEKIEGGKESTGRISKRQKRNQKKQRKIAENESAANNSFAGDKEKNVASGGFDAAGNDWSSNVNFGKKFESKLNVPSIEDQTRGGNDFRRPINRQNGPENNAIKRKAPKIRDDKEHKRRKPDVKSIKCTINGMDLEIVKYDGFPVKKEDAERLKDLRQQMVLKGIPKSEIDAAMKLERRKAEKALARVRKQVCFHCRKAGHNLSDCPELGEGESATGICFKCGSTEHTHFECKVTKKQEYGFASCFICREQGHIAKQCPDNPKGLYPQGGSCKICGDVTHLRKDCPDLTKEKEENSMTLSTIAENTLESLDEDLTKKVVNDEEKKTKGKIVKF